MSDNVVLPGTGATIASDEAIDGTLGTVQFQIIKLADGTLGSTNKAVVSSGGALKVDNSAVTQPVSGTFWQTTQPVSASSLPLPSGASTSAKQPALGTAGTASADVITVQGIASMTALKTDGSGVTQPVSGTVTVQQSTAANLKVDISGTAANTTAIKVDGSAVTQPISVATVPTHAVTQSGTWTVQPGNTANTTAWKVDGSAVTQPVSGTVTANAGTGTFATSDSNAAAIASTTSGQKGFLGLGAVTTAAPTYTTAQSNPLSLTTAGALRTDSSATTQPVSGTFWQATQPVSGTVTANAGTGTMAVSAASLPLPSGASTSAKQPALGTAGTASADVITVQGITSMTALKTDGSGVTQPVSGTFWQTTQPVSGTVTANAGTGTMAVSAASLPLPSGAATAVKQPALGTAGSASADVITVQGITSMTALKVDGSGVTQPVSGTFWQATQPVSAASLPLPSGASTSAKQPALGTAGTASSDVLTVQGIASMTALKVDGSAVTQPVSGTFWQATQPVSGTVSITANSAVNMAQVSGTTTDTNSGTKSAGTQRIVIATDQPQLTNALKVDGSAVTQPVSGTVSTNASQTGTWTVQPGNTPNSTAWLVQTVAGTSGGWSVNSQTGLTNTKVAVKASAGTFAGYMVYNPGASAAYIQVFDVASASVTLGTTAPTYVIALPAGAAANVEFKVGITHTTAITLAATTTATGLTAPATALTGFFLFK